MPPTGTEWDSEVRPLLEPRAPLGLPAPAYDGRSLPNVTASVLRALDVSIPGTPTIAPPLVEALDPFRGRRADGPIVVFLVDGFGGSSFTAWARGEGAYGRRWAELAHPITSVFPTTTTAALVSLSTGTVPGRSGVVGYRQFLPAFGYVADLLRMTPVGIPHPESLVGPRWDPRSVSEAPPVFARGATGLALSRDRFQGSGFTQLLYEGAEYVPYSTASDLAHLMGRLLERSPPPGVIYAYWDELDTVHHLRGPVDPLFGFEADRLAQLLEFVARHVPRELARSTTILLTADHGQVPVETARTLRVDRVPEIAREMGRPLGGDRRAGYFSAKPGRRDALRAALARHLPEGHQIVEAEDAIRAGLFGPPPLHPELAERVGDFIVFVPPPCGVQMIAPGGKEPTVELLGAHGGLAPEELIVPFVSGRLSEFADGD